MTIIIAGTADIQKYSRRSADKSSSNRFMTQPVTVDEVQEAAKLKEVDDPSGTISALSFGNFILFFYYYYLRLLQMKKRIPRT